MLIILILLIALFLVYALSNYRNKFTWFIVGYFFSIIFMSFVNIIYMSKVAPYNYLFDLDYTLYIRLSKLKISIYNLMNLFHLGVALFMLSTVVCIRTLKRIGLPVTFLMLLPIGLYLFLHNSAVKWNLFLNMSAETGRTGLNLGIHLLFAVSNFFAFFYAILPLLVLAGCCKATKIRIKRNGIIIAFISILFIDFIYFYILNASKDMNIRTDVFQPGEKTIQQTYGSIILIVALISIMDVLLFVIYKPFQYLSLYENAAGAKENQRLNRNFGSVIHTYKNAFVGMQKQIELLRKNITEGNLDRAGHNLEICEGIISDQLVQINHILNLSRQTNLKYTDIELFRLINHALKNAKIDQDIRIETSFEAESIKIQGDFYALCEVVTNILNNASEALQFGQAGAKRIKIHVALEEDFASICIYDNGCGIPRRNIKNIFNPFFSTKPRTTNLGIGLSYCRLIVNNHNGDISVSSKEGEYTCFQIDLPLKYKAGHRMLKY